MDRYFLTNKTKVKGWFWSKKRETKVMWYVIRIPNELREKLSVRQINMWGQRASHFMTSKEDAVKLLNELNED